MKVVSPSFEIITMESGTNILKRIEAAGRTCYKSEDQITDDSAVAFVQRILNSGHHSVIEHASATVRFICDRGITHEIVRHRLASYSQESTRYANYSKDKFGNEITVIRPCYWEENSTEYSIWLESMKEAERAYLSLIEKGVTAQEARSVLPSSLKTEIIVTCNIREWRHIFELRCASAAHPQMREIMLPLLAQMHDNVPPLFADLYSQFQVVISSMQDRKG
ncbi:MAG: FAD-dependent thymidylate synthase [Desulfovibrio sp.]|jgi:thymidylate synthase (FAD)|nr:FAD-dependent thymidylate synthase [Desulfovibrio sp.]